MKNILCLDIGSGTQDALLYIKGERLENCPKLVLPSPARMVGQRIRSLTGQGRPIYLFGRNMGGGFSRDLSAHLEAGLAVAAHPEAALALADDPAGLKDKGIELSRVCPPDHVAVHLSDFDPAFWRGLLAQAGLAYPDLVLAAAQDHGFHPGSSNRLGRFQLWESFLRQADGRMSGLLFREAPEQLTRLRVLQQQTGGGPVSDTGAIAVLGALFVPEIEARSREQGVLVVNLGNSHTIAFLVFRDRVWGVYEHHTGLLDRDTLWEQLKRFRSGSLAGMEVFQDRGHGCMVRDLPAGAEGFGHTVVLGPQRDMLAGLPVEFPAPGGDMMLAGCFGLLKGWHMQNGQDAPGD